MHTNIHANITITTIHTPFTHIMLIIFLYHMLILLGNMPCADSVAIYQPAHQIHILQSSLKATLSEYI